MRPSGEVILTESEEDDCDCIAYARQQDRERAREDIPWQHPFPPSAIDSFDSQVGSIETAFVTPRTGDCAPSENGSRHRLSPCAASARDRRRHRSTCQAYSVGVSRSSTK